MNELLNILARFGDITIEKKQDSPNVRVICYIRKGTHQQDICIAEGESLQAAVDSVIIECINKLRTLLVTTQNKAQVYKDRFETIKEELEQNNHWDRLMHPEYWKGLQNKNV